LAVDGADIAGIVAMRPLDEDGICELKRLFVREAWRRRGLGRELTMRVIKYARGRDYAAMCLETVPQLEAAIALYLDLGFKEIGSYSEDSSMYLNAELRYFELDLKRDA
jgi:ribosomal protein S18 acetylase RimI-like enzyme